MATLRNHVVFFLVTFTFFTASFGQTKADQIKFIKTEFKAINGDPTLKKIILENEEFLENMTDGGGELTGFYKAGKIKKIYQWIGLSNGIEIKEYYFKDGQLIFVYEKFRSFIYDKKKEQLDFTKTETTFEGRYYFNRKRLIDSVTTGHNRFENDGPDKATTLLAEANDNLELLSKKKITS